VVVRKLRRLLHDPKLARLASIELIVVISVATYFLNGGEDLYRFYRPFAKGCLTCAFTPWHAHWIFFPLRFIPPQILWSVWTLLTLSGLYWVSNRLDTNPFWLFMSFPVLALIWLGQTDVIVAIGIMLAFKSKNVWLRSFGIVLASIKPQLSGLALLLLFFEDEEKFKLLILPFIVFVLTFVIWGITWPFEWLSAIPEEYGSNAWTLASIFPYGLLAFALVPLVKDRQKRVAAMLMATTLAVPVAGVYSYTLFLILFMPVWSVPLSYVWVLAYPWLGNSALWFAWILPLCMLVALSQPELMNIYRALKGRLVKPATNDGN